MNFRNGIKELINISLSALSILLIIDAKYTSSYNKSLFDGRVEYVIIGFTMFLIVYKIIDAIIIWFISLKNSKDESNRMLDWFDIISIVLSFLLTIAILQNVKIFSEIGINIEMFDFLKFIK